MFVILFDDTGGRLASGKLVANLVDFVGIFVIFIILGQWSLLQ